MGSISVLVLEDIVALLQVLAEQISAALLAANDSIAELANNFYPASSWDIFLACHFVHY